MLLQFTVGNYRSFRERVTFSLVAEPREVGHEGSLTSVRDNDPTAPKALSLAALYGANASGKSNLLRAIDFLRRLVVDGTRPQDVIPVDRFLLDGQTEIKPSFFEVHFFWQGEVFAYGLECDVNTVYKEWLRTSLEDTLLYERVTEGEQTRLIQTQLLLNRTSISPERLQFIAEGVRTNQTFLIQAADQAPGFLRAIWVWFLTGLSLAWPDLHDDNGLMELDISESRLKALGEFLLAADTGIKRVELVEEDFNLTQLQDEVRRDVESSFISGNLTHVSWFLNNERFTLKRDLVSGKVKRLRLRGIHSGKGGKDVPMDWTAESDGTRRMAELWQLIFIERGSQVRSMPGIIGRSIFVDELERSLHPELSRFLLQQWRNHPSPNTQLIFTTHNDNLLEDDLLRRDEVWFVEKDREGGSRLTSEVEYKPIPGVTRQRAYLDGMYGGTPRIMGRRFHWQDRGKV
jgi:uncharacterized protein